MPPCNEIFYIRRARVDDARAMAEVHIATWRDAYRDLVPDEVLRGLSVDNRERMWRDELNVVAADRRPWIAEAGSKIIGFVTAGASRDVEAKSGEGEIYAIYVLPDCWDRGIGRNLLAHARRDLVGHGYNEAILWCFADNSRARAFYEKLGWHFDGGLKPHTYGGRELEESRYRIALERDEVAELI